MRARLSSLVVGEVFRFIDKLDEFVIMDFRDGKAYYQPINYKLGPFSRSIPGYITVEVSPYNDFQQSLF